MPEKTRLSIDKCEQAYLKSINSAYSIEQFQRKERAMLPKQNGIEKSHTTDKQTSRSVANRDFEAAMAEATKIVQRNCQLIEDGQRLLDRWQAIGKADRPW